MSNDHIKSEISAYLAGGLPEAQNRQIEAHAAACEKCRQALAKARAKLARQKREALKKASPDPLPNLFLARQGKNAGVDRPSSKAPAIIAAILIAGAAAYGLYRHFFLGTTHASESAAAEPDTASVNVSSTPVTSTSTPAAVKPDVAASVPEPVHAVPPPPASPLRVQQEWRGEDSAIKESRLVVIRNEATWQSLWSEMQEKEALPTVNFDRHLVICIFGGERPGGTTIQLRPMLERADDVVIPYRISSSSVSGSTVSVTGAGLSHPYLLSLIPRVEKRIRVTQREVQ